MKKLICVYDSPLGKIFIESDGEFLNGLWFEYSVDEKKHEKSLKNCEIQQIDIKSAASVPVIKETCGWLDIYFAGKNPSFTPKFKIENLTPFRSQVVKEMCKIPYGKTATYGDIAKEIALQNGISKMSAQAVGGAVGWNPICIIVPCHRVVGANKSLTGYGGGIRNKIALLKLEGIDVERFSLPKSQKFL